MPQGGLRAWQLLNVLQKRLVRWTARWRAKTATNFKLRITMLLAFGVLVTVVGAVLYRWSNPEEDWSSALFTVYAVLYSIPGADITNNSSLLATVVLNLIFIFGLLVFATILAMITDEINNVLLAARSGKAPVALSGHILLLNWNQQVPFILEQLEQIQLRGGSHPFAGRPLVILADKDKDELDTLVLGLLKHGQLEVHTRSGKPYKLEHLARVSAADAAAVLVMHPEASGGGDEDAGEAGEGGGDDESLSAVGAAAADADSAGAAALKLQTIMALTSQLAGKKVAMVVQAPDDDNLGLQELDQVLLRAGHPANLMNLPVKKMVNSLAVQTTLQPWSATIYHRVLQQDLQPSLAFVKVPDTLFVLKSGEAAGISSSPTAAATAGDGLLQGNHSRSTSSNYPATTAAAGSGDTGVSGLGFLPGFADCTVSFEEARVAVAADLLTIGYINRSSGQLHLNPPETNRLGPGDILVALTTHDAVATAGVKMPLTARLQASLLKTALVLQSHPTVSKAITLGGEIGGKLKRKPRPALPTAAAPAAGRDTDTEASTLPAAVPSAAAGSSSTPDNSVAVAEKQLVDKSAEGPSRSKPTALEVIEEAANDSRTVQGATSKAPGAAAASASASAAVGAGSTAPKPAQKKDMQAPGIEPGTPSAARDLQSGVLAGAVASAGASAAATAAGGAGVGAAGACRSAGADAAAVSTDDRIAPTTPQASAAAPAPIPASSPAPGGVPITAAGDGAASHLAAAADDDVAAAADDPSAAAATAATAAASASTAAVSAKKGSNKSSISNKKGKARKSSGFLCCFAAPAVEEGDGDETGLGKAKGFGAAGKSTSFKLGKVDIGKTVTGAVTGVTGAVTTVGKTVTGAVTTVADGAVGVTKTVVTGAVSTVADGAALVGKTVVSTASVMTDVVTTVADGAVGLSKTVATGAVSTVAGGAGLITKTVTSAVKATPLLPRGDSISRRGGSQDTTTNPSLLKAPTALLAAPTTWLFGAGKKLTQSTAKALAFGRLEQVDVAAARAPPAQPLQIVVAGFSAGEAASELLPHFLDFAPAGSTVVFVVKEEEAPEGFEKEGTVEEDEEREDAEPLHHCVHYKFMTAANPTSSSSLAVAGLQAADAVLLAADEALRGSPAEADAQVLACLVSIQHLLANKGHAGVIPPRSLAGASSSSTGNGGGGGAAAGGSSGGSSILTSVTKGAALSTFRAAATAATLVKSISKKDHQPVVTQRENSSSSASMAKRQGRKIPHVVACVGTTSSKAVAAAFFGAPTAAGGLAGLSGRDGAAGGAGAAGGGGGNSNSWSSDLEMLAVGGAGVAVGGGGVVGPRFFTYELLVPGEIEGSVLVNVANEPHYVKVVHEMLVTSEGCELYLLAPAAFGFSAGEELSFAEVQEVGRLLRRTAIGVVSEGDVVLVPDNSWRWKVRAHDKIAAIADSW